MYSNLKIWSNNYKCLFKIVIILRQWSLKLWKLGRQALQIFNEMVKSTKSCFNSWISIKPDRTITRLFHIHRLFKWSFSVANYKLLWKRQSKAAFWFNRALSFSSLHITQRVTVIAGVRTAIFIVFCCFLRNQTGHFWQGQKFCHVLQLFFEFDRMTGFLQFQQFVQQARHLIGHKISFFCFNVMIWEKRGKSCGREKVMFLNFLVKRLL